MYFYSIVNVLIFVATRYNPTYKNKPEDADSVVGFCFLEIDPLSITLRLVRNVGLI